MTDSLRIFRKLAQANRLANARLHRACAVLDPAELTALRERHAALRTRVEAAVAELDTVMREGGSRG